MRSMTKGARRAAAAAVLLVAVGSAAACTPDPGMAPATTTTTTTSTTTTTIPTYTVPRTTLQAGSFSASIPSVNVSYLGCGGTYNPPAVTFNGPSVNIPAQTIQGAGVVTLPNVSATLAAASVNLSSFRLSCGFLSYSTGVTLEYSAVTASPSATVNLDNGAVSIGSTTLRINGKLKFPGLGGLSVNLPGFNVTVPGFGATVPLN